MGCVKSTSPTNAIKGVVFVKALVRGGNRPCSQSPMEFDADELAEGLGKEDEIVFFSGRASVGQIASRLTHAAPSAANEAKQWGVDEPCWWGSACRRKA